MHRKAEVKGADSVVLLKYKQQSVRKRSGEESEDRGNTEETDRGQAGKSVVLLFLSFRNIFWKWCGKGQFRFRHSNRRYKGQRSEKSTDKARWLLLRMYGLKRSGRKIPSVGIGILRRSEGGLPVLICFYKT